MSRHKLTSIPDYGSKGLTITLGDYEIKVIVVRQGDSVYCYHNICPHTGVNLDWVADQFLDADGDFILCANHGALFRIEDGRCVSGPCFGQNLLPLKVKIEGNSFEISLK